MGTHISRVKSVDLDAWTDEQLQSVLKWGNIKANKYWEAKLAPGHVPSEAKIENFIRTKYESRRWVMDGPMPDPSTFEAEDDDDIPLSVVKEKQSLERSMSQRAAAESGSSQFRKAQPDLFGDDVSPPARAGTADSAPSRVAQKSEPAPPKPTKPADSLLGLDFFGDPAPAPNRPASAASTPGSQSRPDLKQSILSLYASRPQPPQQPSQSSSGSFGGMQSPPLPQQQPQQSHQSSLGGMNDAFSSLSFANTPSPPIQNQPKASAFSNLGNISSHRSPPSQVASPPSSLGGGSFFDAKPSQPPPQASRGMGSSSGFGVFDSGSRAAPALTPNPNASSGLGDLFDFSTSSPQPPVPPKQTVASPPQQSVFNLSPPAPAPKAQSAAPALSGWSNSDAWGSNAAWGAANTSPPVNKAPAPRASGTEFGWGSGGTLANQSIVSGGSGFATVSNGQPKVSADEDFGGWSSSAPISPPVGTAPAKSGTGFAASEDLFSNVWE